MPAPPPRRRSRHCDEDARYVYNPSTNLDLEYARSSSEDDKRAVAAYFVAQVKDLLQDRLESETSASKGAEEVQGLRKDIETIRAELRDIWKLEPKLTNLAEVVANIGKTMAQTAEQVRQVTDIRFRNATQSERDKWNECLTTLGANVKSGALTKYQAESAVDIWNKAIEVNANVMYPSAGITEDGALYLSWNPGRRCLVIEIKPESIEWFFADDDTQAEHGSETDVTVLPPLAFSFLRGFTRPSAG